MGTFEIALGTILSWTTLLAGGDVYLKGGNIFVSDKFGVLQQLTNSGLDYDASFVSGHREIVYCRRDNTDPFKSSIRVIDIRSKKETVVWKNPVVHDGQMISQFGMPSFDGLRRTCYFLVMHAVTTAALFAFDPSGPKPRYLTQAAAYTLIRVGAYKGCLLVFQRRHTLLGDPYYAFWLYGSDGREIGFAGSERNDLADLRSSFEHAVSRAR